MQTRKEISEENLKNFLIKFLISSVIPVSLGILYCLGRAYQMGYLTEFGIQDDLGFLSVDRVLFYGVISLGKDTQFLLYVTLFLAIYIGGLFIFGFFATFIPLPKKKFKYIKIHHDFKEIILIFARILFLLFCAIVIIVVLFSILGDAHKQGEVYAKKQKNNYMEIFKSKKHSNHYYKLFPVGFKGEVKQGFVIASTATNIAFYTNKGVEIDPVSVIRLEQIEQ